MIYSKKIKIYTDESVPFAVVNGLRLLGVEVQSCQEAHNKGLSDIEQLDYARKNDFVIFTHDDDFLRIDAEYMIQEKNHCGIIYAHQKDYSIGECIRRLNLVVDILSPEEMENHVEFL